MAQVSLQVNGYAYVLGCADGEEQHLLALAGELDRRIQDIKAATGPGGEARLLLMAALMLSDGCTICASICSSSRRPPSPALNRQRRRGRAEGRSQATRAHQTRRGDRRSVDALPLAATPDAEPSS